ncbi:MAG: ATP-binding protein [Verrucomicrobia bacterium]|nr:ATP-binding protein [Verrucomicrobiota bacterium]
MNSPAHSTEDISILHVPPLFSQLRTIRQAVRDLCSRARMSEFEAAQLEMAVDEACANVIEHSYADIDPRATTDQVHVLRLKLIHAPDSVRVEITDRGEGFDFESTELLDPKDYLEAGRERGLGMYIINRFVDSARYERGGPEGNCLTLTKLL